MDIPLFKTYWDEQDVHMVSASIRRGMYWAEGPNIEKFEQSLIEYLGIPGVLVCNSGTSALHMAMIACGIKHYHEVIVPSFTFIATVNAVKFVGAKSVFADIEEETLGLSPLDVESKITPQTKAIIAVHYAGHPCQIRELRQVARKHNLMLIEDAAEALGASDIGQFGDCSVLSFCANKIISTGEGGALVTDNKYIYDRAKLARSHGRADDSVNSNKQGDYISLGYNFRMSDMTAGLGIAQLEKIDKLVEMRQTVASWYREGLKGLDLRLPLVKEGSRNVYQLFTIRVKDRDKVQRHLAENGIASKVYFYPVHQTAYYRQQGWEKVNLPVTERVSNEVLSLPMYPDLTQNEVEYICEKIKEAN